MKTHTLITLMSLSLLTPSLFGQAGTPPISEEARKHFVAGTDLAKEAKTAADLSRVVSEFKQAVELAPQLPQARYNLARAREAAGDYSGAIADLKRYQQFKLSPSGKRNQSPNKTTPTRNRRRSIRDLTAGFGALSKIKQQPWPTAVPGGAGTVSDNHM